MVDNQDYDRAHDETSSCTSSEIHKNYSILDIIAKIESDPDEVKEETFQLNNKKI